MRKEDLFWKALYSVYFWAVVYAYHIILESTVYLYKLVIIYHITLGSTVYLWEVFNDYYFILDSIVVYILKSSQCLPFYFGEHCIIMRSCLHLPFYHVQLRWRKVTILFITQKTKNKTPPPPHEMLVSFHIPFPRTTTNNNDQCSWLS